MRSRASVCKSAWSESGCELDARVVVKRLLMVIMLIPTCYMIIPTVLNPSSPYLSSISFCIVQYPTVSSERRIRDKH